MQGSKRFRLCLLTSCVYEDVEQESESIRSLFWEYNVGRNIELRDMFSSWRDIGEARQSTGSKGFLNFNFYSLLQSFKFQIMFDL